MNPSNNILCSWSGGKDSCFALMVAIKSGYQPSVLLNVLNEEGKISRSHGIPAAILQAQAISANLPIHLFSSSWDEYELKFSSALSSLKDQYLLSHAVFGDIDLQAHRDWEEKVCKTAGLQAVLPLWKQNRPELVKQMLASGIRTMIVSCNETMGPDFLGEMLTPPVIEKLEKAGIDVCGENGEFHTLVLDCPLFKDPINVQVNNKNIHNNYWFSSLSLK